MPAMQAPVTAPSIANFQDLQDLMTMGPTLRPSLMGASCLLFQAPAVDRFDVEAPIATDVERWNLILLEEPINRGLMDVQIV